MFGLSWNAESWKLARLRELDIEGMGMDGIVLPHGLERAAFRNASFTGPLWLDNCECAAVAPAGKHGAGQRLHRSPASAMAQ